MGETEEMRRPKERKRQEKYRRRDEVRLNKLKKEQVQREIEKL